MHGLLNILKPSGPTSHDVVARVRCAAHLKRVGHAGTLDPAASGVLLVCLGNATRVIEYAMDWRKSYRAVATFGVETDSEDATGITTAETDASGVTRADIESLLPRFTGEIMQIPPMVSALHHEGRRLYDIARSGATVEREARPVTIYSLRLVEFHPGERPTAVLDVECSKGTYIRTLCADIGRALGVGGHMQSLVRTAVGPFRIEDAVTLEAVEEAGLAGSLAELTHSISEILADMPSVSVAEENLPKLRNGVGFPVDAPLSSGSTVCAVDAEGRVLAIGVLAESESGTLVFNPKKVFAE